MGYERAVESGIKFARVPVRPPVYRSNVIPMRVLGDVRCEHIMSARASACVRRRIPADGQARDYNRVTTSLRGRRHRRSCARSVCYYGAPFDFSLFLSGPSSHKPDAAVR